MDVNVKINGNCQLIATPIKDLDLESVLNPCLSDSDATMFLEFVVSPNLNVNSTLRLSRSLHYYEVNLPEDGLYIYYKLKIFNKRYVEKDYSGLCYDPINEVLMFKNEKLTNILEVLPYLDQGFTLEYIKVPVFSICRLQNCLMQLQKNSISKCNHGLCDKFDSDKQIRDFLFISIYILENLICEERFGEADDILKSLESCVPICKSISSSKSDCNCKNG